MLLQDKSCRESNPKNLFHSSQRNLLRWFDFPIPKTHNGFNRLFNSHTFSKSVGSYLPDKCIYSVSKILLSRNAI